MEDSQKCVERLSRRRVLTGMAALAVSGAVPCRELLAQNAVPGRRGDIHHHMFAPDAVKTFRANFDGGQPGPLRLEWTPEKSLEAMEAAGIDTALLSCNIPFGDNPGSALDDVRRVARDMNDVGARVGSDHKGRFGLLAALPLPDVDASLREIEYALDTLQADGFGLLTNYGGKYIGDAELQPVFDELNRRRAIVYVHPVTAPCCHDLLPDTGSHNLEWNTDTSRAIWNMINDGQFRPTRESPATRCPDVTFIWSHAGGTLLGLIQRFLGTSAADVLARPPEPNSRLYHLRRFYYDTAVSMNAVQMTALKSLVGASQIVFGSDYPFVSPLDTIQGLRHSGLSADELRGIEGENALHIFPKWKQV